MPVKQKSFFQTTAGFVTGVAGILTAVAGIATVGAQFGWFSGSDGKSDSTTVTSAPADAPSQGPGGGPAVTSGRSGSTTALAQFSVDPTSVTFESLANISPRDEQVTVSNTGSSPISFDQPAITGTNPTAFQVANQTCGGRLPVGSSCQLKVTFAPARGGTYTAVLVVKASGGPSKDIQLKGASLL